MANRTAKYANSIHGTNPQYLIEKIIRTRIHESKYWKENCTLLNSALVLERAVDDLRYVGGVYASNIKPTPFICLALKMLQIQPQKEIVYLYIDQPDFKYLRALGAFYLRLVGSPVEVYTKLEPLYRDYRKLRIVDRSHKFSVIHMDELIDNLLREERVFDVILPRLTKRFILENNGDIGPYKSELEEQNLIPTQIIEEKVEQKVEEIRRHGSSRNDYQETKHYDDRHRSRGGDDIDRRSRYSHHDDKRNRYSRHDDRRRHDDYRSGSRRHEHRGDHSRARSRSPQNKQEPSKYSCRKQRFSQEEIDNENAIRAKVGLKPLR